MRAFGWVFIATVVARFTSLISFPVTARTLSVADMGELSIWHTLRGMILLAAFAGLPDIVARESARQHDHRAFFAALKISYLVLAVVALALGALQFAAPGAVTIVHPQLLLLAAAVDVVPGLMLASLAAMGQIRAYALCIVLPAVAVAVTTVVLVLPPFSMGIVGPLYAHIASSVLNAVICLWLVARHRDGADTPPAPPPQPMALLRQSLPILGVSLVGMSIVTVDRYSIRGFDGAEALGYYAVAFQAAALLSFGGGAVRTSISQKILAHIGQPSVIARCIQDYLVCGCAFALLLAALAPEVVGLLAGRRYMPQVQLVPVLCAAFLGLELYSLGQALAVARTRSDRAFRAILAAAAVAVLSIPAACYAFGTPGVALSLVLAYGVAAALVHPVQALAGRSSLPWLAAAGVGFVLLALHYRHPDTLMTWTSAAARYLLAAACASVGVRRLRDLGRTPSA